MTKTLGKPIVIENVAGAGGTLGSRRGAQAAPDGYTLTTVSPGTHAGAPALYANLGYHPVDSYDIIGLAGTTPMVLVGKGKLPASTLQEFIAHLRANQDKLSVATAGVGSMSHLTCSFFHSLVGAKTTEVPYRAMPAMLQDVVGGSVDYTCTQAQGLSDFLNTGAMKAYVVADDRRLAALPNVPSADEAGLPKFKVSIWIGLAAPKGTPAAIVSALNRAMAAAFDDPELRARYTELAFVIPRPEERTSEWFTGFMRAEMERWTSMLQAAGVKPAN
jgi:tripartite-type tricarboxylate transporter receptor subunit TctC